MANYKDNTRTSVTQRNTAEREAELNTKCDDDDDDDDDNNNNNTNNNNAPY